jgi:hypothetical protein
VLIVGCTRYGTNPAGGPFVRKPRLRPEPYSPVPPAPPATSSPLALGTPTSPEVRPTPDKLEVVPPRPPEPVALDNDFRTPPPTRVVPAGGIVESTPTAGQLLPRRRPDPLPGQIPSPFAKDAAKPTPASPIAEVKKLVEAATATWKKVDCYEATVTRRELAPNKKLTEDVVLYRFRKEPIAVYIKNLGEAGKGREIIYYPAKHGDKIYAIVGKGDEGFNAATETFEDLVKAGVIDPAKVVRNALQNASSIASLLLTTEALISEIPEEKKESPMPGGPGGSQLPPSPAKPAIPGAGSTSRPAP